MKLLPFLVGGVLLLPFFTLQSRTFQYIETPPQIISLSPGDTIRQHVRIFPNPAGTTAVVHFQNPDQIVHHFYLVDVEGKVVRTFADIRGEEVTLSLSGLPHGLYLFELRGKVSYYGRMMVQ